MATFSGGVGRHASTDKQRYLHHIDIPSWLKRSIPTYDPNKKHQIPQQKQRDAFKHMMPSNAKSANYDLAKVALGEVDADLAIVNGALLNVYTAEVLDGQTVLIKGDKIAYAGKYAKRGIGPQTHVVDAAGKVLIPGFIDGHTHMDYLHSTTALAPFAVKSGTTAIITETTEIAFRLGYRGILEYVRSTQDQPIKFWFTLPPMGTISPIAAEHLISLNEVKRLLRRRDFLGLGEVYWGAALQGDSRLRTLIEATLQAGKKVEGHSAGATANKLQAYTALGVSSDHEPIAPAETLERLRVGLSVMAREGEVREDLAGVAGIKDAGVDLRRLAVCSDGIGALQLTRHGFMDYIVQKAIRLGFKPIQAIQMATLNVAEHFGLQDVIGGIAPGRFADIAALPALDEIQPELVVSNGRVVFEHGQVVENGRTHQYAGFTREVLRLQREFRAEDFRILVNRPDRGVKVRIIEQLSSVLTRESQIELPMRNGEIQPAPDSDVVKVAMIEYVNSGGKTFTGLIKGTGLRRGAVATSTCWDSTDLAVVGADEKDMALAVNRIRELGGAAVVCRDGQILAEAALPIATIISPEPIETLAGQLQAVQTAAKNLGCVSPDIRTTLSVLPTPAIPYLRICESGLFDVRTNQAVDLVV